MTDDRPTTTTGAAAGGPPGAADAPPGPSPDPSQVHRAVDIYMSHAYDNPPPLAVRSMLATVRGWAGPLLKCPSFVRTGDDPARARYSLRLGNRHYPHMKLVVEPAPGGPGGAGGAGAPFGYFFKADCHDRHVCPPEGAPEYAAFRQLMDENQRLSERIEEDWTRAGLPTFKAYLREDLARRRQQQQAPAS